MNSSHYMTNLGEAARHASKTIASADTQTKDKALVAIADELVAKQSDILDANAKDIKEAQKKGLADALIDRLTLTSETVENMAKGIVQISELPDPVGEISDMRPRPSGIKVGKMRVPIGVIGMIYESRPNVTADAAGLCLKSGNAVILRGGSESFNSNQIIGQLLNRQGAVLNGIREFEILVLMNWFYLLVKQMQWGRTCRCNESCLITLI